MSEVPQDQPWLNLDFGLMIPAELPDRLFDMLELIREWREEIAKWSSSNGGEASYDPDGWCARRLKAMYAYVLYLETTLEARCGWKRE